MTHGTTDTAMQDGMTHGIMDTEDGTTHGTTDTVMQAGMAAGMDIWVHIMQVGTEDGIHIGDTTITITTILITMEESL